MIPLPIASGGVRDRIFKILDWPRVGSGRADKRLELNIHQRSGLQGSLVVRSVAEYLILT